MHKLITFRELKEICGHKYWSSFENFNSCEHNDVYEENAITVCCEKNCPVWKGLKESKT
jgi:hypothetical protein